MKLNIWQWLGLILLVVGVASMIFLKEKPADEKTLPPATQPTTMTTQR